MLLCLNQTIQGVHCFDKLPAPHKVIYLILEARMIFARFALAAIPLLLVGQQAVVGPPGSGPQTGNPQAANAADKCTVEGQVINTQTGAPVMKAHVTLQGTSGQNRANYSAVADAGGHFSMRDIDPGQYQLSAARNGFVSMRESSRGSNQSSISLTLNPGQHMSDIALRLIPHGVVTGRVLDEDGEPVEYVQISTMRYRFFNGKRQLAPAGGGTATNDLGEYRIFQLAPGKYYLTATYRRQNMMAQDRASSGTPDEGYAPTFYPGTNDPAGAVMIEVGPGATVNVADLTLRKTRTVRIRGRVVNTMGEGLPQHIMLRLMPRNTRFGGFFSTLTTQIMRNQGGTFELCGVTPGAYSLMAQWSDGEKAQSVRQQVDVGNSNVDDVNLALTPGIELKGQVRAEGNGEVSPGAMWVMLEAQSGFPMGRANARLAEDRTFTLENVSADQYTVNVQGLPENFYVKSIRLGDTDGLDTGLDLTRGGSGVLDILISPNGGQVEGTVTGPNQQPPARAMVVIVPELHREQSSLFKIGGVDQSGHFTIKGIAPGDYKLFAWEQIEMGAYQDPEFLKKYESQGEAVAIREGSRENRQLKLIPADAAAQESDEN